MMTGNILVETRDLTKKYGEITAVDHLNLRIEEGKIYGLLGPNGAGKTTTILMLLGLTEPTSGQALVAGYDATRNPLKVKSIVGYLPDNVGFYQEMTGVENLFYTTSLNGISPEESRKRINYALERVGLAEVGHRKVGEYSRGMRQRLGIADLLVKDPKLIILDEPTLGIDPEGVRELLKLIKNLSVDDGRTVLISSHMLHQIQQICDEVGIFVKGRLIASGTIEELGSQLMPGSTMQFEIKAEPEGDELARLFWEIEGVEDVQKQGDIYLLSCREDIRDTLVKNLVAANYTLLHLQMRGVSLDSIYLRYFEKEGYYEQSI
ncbi:MAG: ABC transporter ATP-binding protein [Peptococcaceae bacterium]|jgi:ABC-2 type transport system ATP-binding protein|nr:ABC transporter ATP-binding protein [Peptococcaceae bacterium]MDH7523848.1 ABC transporter ATP-binding protein [Peptococcaceae bacterium]